ncbi:hypothetical protein [Pseudoxanthomonas winnipegensis]|uniref:Uncharacterized protein n=1 Tax=Pseudoxanthomonas winnipegensis TaxID=2480810 RepID=A0A4Q8LZL8_9GAMM|nr:hypothetical protein [Pseudoxanthomonas winnipegensis]RZZ90636.1 hypothetical protein EA663_02460 [Pseudoxanthomonas winnipegensis]TAA11264.1 hypothetical protein EA659_07920 [Pseudoxanthomonas winnipegensis]TAA18687.1 hypothetical protein EA658_16505 [Pseudoxanthomonas winnipegensis]TAA37209.1 hypothetical protein EA656_00580 [Pseudoxanthomonas winnipegensis]TAH73937.1 hypothetical protein EA657_00240 [Pseudoxanthomonas winnipegensis]
MSAQILTLRPFQSARAAARSAGFSDAQALREIRAAQRLGREGNEIVGQVQERSRAIRRGQAPTDGGSAA